MTLYRPCLILSLVAGLLTGTPARAEITVTDAVGREVTLPGPARRIVLNDSLLILSLALLADDPVAPVAGWGGAQRLDAGLRTTFRTRFPIIDDVPEVAGVTARTSSAEAILSVAPDLFVVTLWEPEWEPLADLLTTAGVPVMFLENPQDHSEGRAGAAARALGLLGMATGHDAQARDYSAFVAARMDDIGQRVASLPPGQPRPRVLVDAHAGLDCCSVPGRDNMLTEMVDFAGGDSVGSAGIAGYDGTLNTEFLVTAPSDIYVGTGGAHLAHAGGLVLGFGVSEGDARASLAAVTSGDVRRNIPAVVAGHVHGVSHQMSISALHIVITECFARWIHPELFSGTDPTATLREINARFMAVPLDGSFCVDLTATP